MADQDQDFAGDQNSFEPLGHSVTRSLGHSVKLALWSATAINVVKQIRRDDWWRTSMQGLQQISQISKGSTQCYIDFVRPSLGLR